VLTEAERVFIGLGSNLGDSQAYLSSAISAISRLPRTTQDIVSPFYRSTPLINEALQPDYLNAVLAVFTRLEPLQLLTHLQHIEQRHDRQRCLARWASRTLDLDILLFGNRLISSSILTVPHPELVHRDFVLYPLNDIAPNLEITGIGVLGDLLRQCPYRGLIKFNE